MIVNSNNAASQVEVDQVRAAVGVVPGRRFRDWAASAMAHCPFGAAAFASLAAKLVGGVVGLGSQFVLALVLGPSIFGDYMYVGSWIALLVAFTTLGFDSASLRFVPMYTVRSQWSELRAFLLRSAHWTACSSVVAACGLAGMIWLLGDRIQPALRSAFYVGCVILAADSMVRVTAFQVQAFHRTCWAQGVLGTIRPLVTTIGVASLLLAGVAFTTTAVPALTVQLLSSVIAFGLVAFVLRRSIPTEARRSTPKFESKRWTKTGLVLLAVAIMMQVLRRLDGLMLGYYLGTEQAGYYLVASSLAMQVTFGLNIVNVITAPRISELYCQRRLNELRRVGKHAVCGALIFAIPIFVILLLWGPWILGLYGPGFSQAALPLFILATGQLINAAVGPVGLFLTMTDRQRIAAGVLVVVVIINAALNMILIPSFGLVGAATATAITTVGWNLTMLIQIRRMLPSGTSVNSG